MFLIVARFQISVRIIFFVPVEAEALYSYHRHDSFF